MQCLRRSRVDSARASSEQGTKETAMPLDPSDPCSLTTLDKAWRVSDHKSVRSALDVKIKIPAEVFLTRLWVGMHAFFAELMNQPFCQVIAETAGVDETTSRLGDVKGRAFERDDRSDFCSHTARTLNWFPKGPCGGCR